MKIIYVPKIKMVNIHVKKKLNNQNNKYSHNNNSVNQKKDNNKVKQEKKNHSNHNNNKGESGGEKLKNSAGNKGLFWALLLFVGIPLPGTGAWTGTLAASFLNLDFKTSITAVTLVSSV